MSYQKGISRLSVDQINQLGAWRLKGYFLQEISEATGYAPSTLTRFIGIALARCQLPPECKNRFLIASAVQPLLNSLLVTTLIEVPAFVGAVISLQPTKIITTEQVSTQRLQPPPTTAQEKSSTDTVEVPTEE